MKKNIFMQKHLWKIFKKKKQMFLIFCPKKSLNSAVKKKGKNKIFFYKNKFGKNFFYKK
jgi:hypothetical protein